MHSDLHGFYTMCLIYVPIFLCGECTTIFPFFDGLIPEGWLLDIAEHT